MNNLITQIRVRFPKDALPEGIHAKVLRGAICAQDPDNPILSQHDGTNYVWTYPKVHYRWWGDLGYIIGFGKEASQLITSLTLPGTVLQMGDYEVPIIGTDALMRPLEVKESRRMIRYPFLSPWLALNQRNNQEYFRLSYEERTRKLDKIARNQLVNTFADLEIPLDFNVQAFAHTVGDCFPVHYKDTEEGKPVNLAGFWGYLICNIELPSFFAVGQKTSFGHGWLRVNQDDPQEVIQ